MQEHEWKTAPVPNAAQVEIYFRRESYSAFPHLVRLDGDELLLAFREAPRVEGIQHTHPRSVITLIRSYDKGATWEVKDASQMGAGGGQEFSLIALGGGTVAGALAWHEVVPVSEKGRTGVPHSHAHEYPFRTPGSYWAWSHTYGLTWQPHHIVFLGPGTMACGPVCLTQDGSLLCPVYGYGNGERSSLLYRSLDKGRTWSGPVVMARGEPGGRHFCEPCVVEIAPRVLCALHRIENDPDNHGCFWSNTSLDGGATWSKPGYTGIRSGACPRMIRLADGRLLLTFGRRCPPFAIRGMLSEDGGATWGETAWIITPLNNGNQGYTSSVELGAGRILTVSYAENREGVTGIIGAFWDLPRKATRSA